MPKKEPLDLSKTLRKGPGREASRALVGLLRDLGIGFVEPIGTIRDLMSATLGVDPITAEELSPRDRALAGAMTMMPLATAASAQSLREIFQNWRGIQKAPLATQGLPKGFYQPEIRMLESLPEQATGRDFLRILDREQRLDKLRSRGELLDKALIEIGGSPLMPRLRENLAGRIRTADPYVGKLVRNQLTESKAGPLINERSNYPQYEYYLTKVVPEGQSLPTKQDFWTKSPSYRETLFYMPDLKFRSEHFGYEGKGAKGLVAHMRGDIREFPEGQKALVIDTMQSDYASEAFGRRAKTEAAEIEKIPELKSYWKLLSKEALRQAAQEGAQKLLVAAPETQEFRWGRGGIGALSEELYGRQIPETLTRILGKDPKKINIPKWVDKYMGWTTRDEQRLDTAREMFLAAEPHDLAKRKLLTKNLKQMLKRRKRSLEGSYWNSWDLTDEEKARIMLEGQPISKMDFLYSNLA